MRLVILAALAALASAPAPAQTIGIAPSPVPAPAGHSPLAVDEVLFEVAVVGSAASPADDSVVNVSFNAPGQSAPAARAAASALCERLVEIARRFGAERSGAGSNSLFGMMDSLAGMVAVHQASGEESAEPDFMGHGSLRLSLNDPGRFEELRAALEEAGAHTIVGPIHVLNDDSSARRRARADALARARAEAEAFAAGQNMRVARLLRFSEAADGQAELMRTMMAQFGRGTGGEAAEVEVRVPVQIAFALAPR